MDVIVATASRNKDHWRLAQNRVLLQMPADFEAADARQINVESNEVKIAVPRELKSLRAGLGGNHVASGPLEEEHNRLQHVRVIFNHKNIRFHKVAKIAGSQYCYAGVTIKLGVAVSVKFDFWPCPGRNIQLTLSAPKFGRRVRNWG